MLALRGVSSECFQKSGRVSSRPLCRLDLRRLCALNLRRVAENAAQEWWASAAQSCPPLNDDPLALLCGRDSRGPVSWAEVRGTKLLLDMDVW